MVETSYDLIVIGAGPGGYVAAIRAAQLGMRVACIDGRGALGGTCLNVGCIPSKALLHSSALYAAAEKDFRAHGIQLGKVSLDLAAMMKRKDKVVADLTNGISFLFRKNKIAFFEGWADIPASSRVIVTPIKGGDAVHLHAPSILIATGSEPAPIPGIVIDEKKILSSTGALDLKQVPNHLVVIGSGAVGLELGSVWARLGARVTVIEWLGRILPHMDSELAKTLQAILAKQGLTFRFGCKVVDLDENKSDLLIRLEPAQGGEKESLSCDAVLVAIGRRPYTKGLDLAALGIKTDARGSIVVDSAFQTSAPGIYAVGDAVPGPMLAHKAEEDGVACVEILAGQAGHVDYATVPSIVYTHPEAASVGQTEDQLKADSIAYCKGLFPFQANSRARANAETEGFVKLLSHAETDRLLGCHIVGPGAGELIQECVTTMAFCGAAEDIARICHGHPGYGEAVREAALSLGSGAIHI